VRRNHVLIIVQNLPVPLDRRVWLECQALTAAGYTVSVICPKGPGDASREVLEGVHLYKYRPAPDAKGTGGFVWEFAYSWLRTALLSVVVFLRQPFGVLQACNPPDTYWLLARMWRWAGVSFVFDQHDLNPELYLSRFGQPTGRRGRAQLGVLRWLEARTYAAADRVISTNESYRRIARGRGKKCAADVTVVRSGPNTARMRPVYPPTGLRHDDCFLLVYLGIMGPQDGVEVVLDVVHELVHRRGRTEVHAALLGFGDCLDDLRKRAAELDLNNHVTFTGRAGSAVIAHYLSAADVGICPDLKTPLNDVSTMNKTMEYMAYALPSVAFDLVETRVTGADAVLYVPSGDVGAMSDEVERLLDDPGLRVKLARAARERVVAELDWQAQAVRYVGVFDDLVGRRSAPVSSVWPSNSMDRTSRLPGADYVDLDNEAEFDRFIVERTDRRAVLGGARLRWTDAERLMWTDAGSTSRRADDLAEFESRSA
jgi:glycosyltransferase involved in cell wall biosynthesis